MSNDLRRTPPHPYTDPPELANMSGQFILGYRQGREDAREEIERLRGLLREALDSRAPDYAPGDWATRAREACK